MKISYISDIHLDFWAQHTPNVLKWKKKTEEFILNLIETDEDEREVLIVAGDISHFNRQSMWAIDLFSQYYHQVFVTYGNHELYLISKSQSDKYLGRSKNRLNEFHAMLLARNNVHPLFTDKVFTYRDVTFGGNPMWYPLTTPEQQMFFRNVSNDSRLIKGVDIQAEHEKSIANYKSMMEEGMDVMISHVPLCHLKSHEKYMSTACYFTPVDELPKYVIQGHSHERAVYKKADSLLYMNCGGYPQDQLGEMEIRSFIID